MGQEHGRTIPLAAIPFGSVAECFLTSARPCGAAVGNGWHRRRKLNVQNVYPGAPRFPQIATIAMVKSRIERGDKIETERRSYIASGALPAAAFAEAVRDHWRIENNLHWALDVIFNEDRSRLRIGPGAKNMAVVRHLALNLVRQITDKRSIKRRRKCAAWDPKYLMEILGPLRR